MTVEQRETLHHVSAATAHQPLVARGPTMRDMDHGQSASDRRAKHCGFLIPEHESTVVQCGSQWTGYMVQWLPQHLESAVAVAETSRSGPRPTGRGTRQPPWMSQTARRRKRSMPCWSCAVMSKIFRRSSCPKTRTELMVFFNGATKIRFRS
jgi:hypothetical protein